MKCEMEHERIVTAAYGELADEQAQELEQHLGDCPECAREQEQVLALKGLADAYPVLEPDANLIARSRQKLEAALDTLPPARWYERLGHRMLNNFASLQAAPVAACLLLLLGVGAGSLGGYRVAENRAAHVMAAQAAQAPAKPVSVSTAGNAAPAEIAAPCERVWSKNEPVWALGLSGRCFSRRQSGNHQRAPAGGAEP